MFVSMEEIYRWWDTNSSKRNIVEGERIVKAGHIIKCGKTSSAKNEVNLLAYCMQTSSLKQKPHGIHGEIPANGEIISMVCSCKAGLGEKCKHIIGTLIYCSTLINSDALPTLSCTDGTCLWKGSHKNKLGDYVARPLEEHPCFVKRHRPNIGVSDDVQSKVRDIIMQSLPQSAFVKHAIGRHGPINEENSYNNPQVSDVEFEAMKSIFDHQESALMKIIAAIECSPLKSYCEKTYRNIDSDPMTICEHTKVRYAVWEKERQCRFTGSTRYNLFTYVNNRNPDWKKKCSNHFKPKKFTSKYTEYGRKSEVEAREMFIQLSGMRVVETGLIICNENPWIGVSPDGVIFEGSRPTSVLEIKCPYKGASMPIIEAVKLEFGKCLQLCDGDYVLKEKHTYYAQVQLNIAVINVTEAFFVMYASFDLSMLVIKAQFDENFVLKMLTALKPIYFHHLLHLVCLEDSLEEGKENMCNN